MSTYVPERGYTAGPTLRPGEKPWGNWEQDERIDDGHPHEWELINVHRWNGLEPVVRCAACHAPRCGHSNDRDPCMERRHHRGLHITLHGAFEPVGGYLREEQA